MWRIVRLTCIHFYLILIYLLPSCLERKKIKAVWTSRDQRKDWFLSPTRCITVWEEAGPLSSVLEHTLWKVEHVKSVDVTQLVSMLWCQHFYLNFFVCISFFPPLQNLHFPFSLLVTIKGLSQHTKCSHVQSEVIKKLPLPSNDSAVSVRRLTGWTVLCSNETFSR